MTTDTLFDEQRLQTLRLRSLPPDETRATRVRARCHRALARRQLRREQSARRARFFRRTLEPMLLGGLCVLYLSAVLLDVMRVYGLL